MLFENFMDCKKSIKHFRCKLTFDCLFHTSIYFGTYRFNLERTLALYLLSMSAQNLFRRCQEKFISGIPGSSWFSCRARRVDFQCGRTRSIFLAGHVRIRFSSRACRASSHTGQVKSSFMPGMKSGSTCPA